MNINKDRKDIKIGVLLSCFKRPEYTKMTLESLENSQEYNNVTFYMIDDGSEDGTHEMLKSSKLPKVVRKHRKNTGLRHSILEFFSWARENKIDIIGILGNDTIVFTDWLNKIVDKLITTDLDIVSPNYLPSNPAYTQGEEDIDNKGYRKAKGIVGTWYMDRRLTDDIYFEDMNLWGIIGSVNIIRQIYMEKGPRIGWMSECLFEDSGHWSGESKYHIKSKEHEEYSMFVGRSIAWRSEQ